MTCGVLLACRTVVPVLNPSDAFSGTRIRSVQHVVVQTEHVLQSKLVKDTK